MGDENEPDRGNTGVNYCSKFIDKIKEIAKDKLSKIWTIYFLINDKIEFLFEF